MRFLGINRVIELVRQAHEGQVDKLGRDYFQWHIVPVVELLEPFGLQAVQAGYLHDIVEDTEVTLTQLGARNVDPVVVSAVESVTRRSGEYYVSLIHRASLHPLGRMVKLADVWVNLRGMSELAKVDPKSATSLKKRYEQAHADLARFTR
jgi:(p)ppGpp synthase/HD superfamily hydrolase